MISHPLYFRQHALQLIQDGQSLWLSVFIEDHFAVNLFHCSQNNGAGVLVPILRVHTLLTDYIGDIKLQFLQLVGAFHFWHLEFAFVQNLDNDLISAHFAELFQIGFGRHSSLLDIGIYPIRLQHIIDIILGFIAPIGDFVLITGQFKQFILLFQLDDHDIGQKFLVDRLLQGHYFQTI